MVRAPYIDKDGVKKGAWSEEEDNKLRAYVLRYGHWNWRQLPKFAGLNRCGKSCRLRWKNYLKPGVKRGGYSPEEEELILKLHQQFGSKWSVIAEKLPGRTDNDIKNHWHSHLMRKKMTVMMMRKKEDDDDDDIHEEKPTIFQKNMDPEYTSSNQDHCYDDKNNEETFPISATMLFDSKPQKMELMETNHDSKFPSYSVAAVDHTELNYRTKSSPSLSSSSSSLSNGMDGTNASADNKKTTSLSDDSSVEENFYWFDDYNENSSFWAQLSGLEYIILPH